MAVGVGFGCMAPRRVPRCPPPYTVASAAEEGGGHTNIRRRCSALFCGGAAASRVREGWTEEIYRGNGRGGEEEVGVVL